MFTFLDLITKYTSIYETTDDKYNFCAVLYNDGNICKLTQQSIFSLSISNDFRNPFHSGVLDILNDNDSLEISNEPTLKAISTSFKFINNGRDFLFLYISPYTKNVTENIDNSSNIVLQFIINSTDDIYVDGKKIKRLYLIDYAEELLKEYSGNFSTGVYAYKFSKQEYNDKFKYNEPVNINDNDLLAITQLSNDERSLSTGKSISLLLNDLFDDFRINENLWDFDGPDVFYSSSPNETYFDVLDNLLKLHNANTTDDDKCYLNYKIDVTNNTFVWTFYSIGYVFQYMAKTFMLETIKLSLKNMDFKDNSSKTTEHDKIKVAGFTSNTGIINKFFFSDLTTDYNLKHIKSKFLYNYDFKNKKFLVDEESSNLEKVVNDFNLNYAANIDKPRYANTPMNGYQQDNHIIQHIRNVYSDNTNVSLGRNETLRNLVALNNSIQFSITGNTNRKSGYFFVLDMDQAPTLNQFLNKVLGEYLILSMSHNFKDKTYINNITASKPFYYQEPIAYNNYKFSQENINE